MSHIEIGILNISYDRFLVLRSIYRAGTSGKRYSYRSSRIQYLLRNGLISCSKFDWNDPLACEFTVTEAGASWFEAHKDLKGTKSFETNYQ